MTQQTMLIKKYIQHSQMFAFKNKGSKKLQLKYKKYKKAKGLMIITY